jgi:hypothetical protein
VSPRDQVVISLLAQLNRSVRYRRSSAEPNNKHTVEKELTMNRIIIAATAGFIALSGAASASTDTFFENDLRAVAPSVDAAALSSAQVDAIKQAFSSYDSATELRAYVTSIVNG